jgi:hypothetical protein
VVPPTHNAYNVIKVPFSQGEKKKLEKTKESGIATLKALKKKHRRKRKKSFERSYPTLIRSVAPGKITKEAHLIFIDLLYSTWKELDEVIQVFLMYLKILCLCINYIAVCF